MLCKGTIIFFAAIFIAAVTMAQHPDLKIIDSLKKVLLDQLGLELVPSNMPVQMLVVEKVN